MTRDEHRRRIELAIARFDRDRRLARRLTARAERRAVRASEPGRKPAA